MCMCGDVSVCLKMLVKLIGYFSDCLPWIISYFANCKPLVFSSYFYEVKYQLFPHNNFYLFAFLERPSSKLLVIRQWTFFTFMS